MTPNADRRTRVPLPSFLPKSAGRACVVGLMLLATTVLSSGCNSALRTGWVEFERGNYEAARSAWEPLAQSGNPKAQFFLGTLYFHGQGVPRDREKAAEWYRRSADQGFAFAQTNLGLMYYEGDGVPQDRDKAAAWYRRAAEQDNPQAMNNLGVMQLLEQVDSEAGSQGRGLI